MNTIDVLQKVKEIKEGFLTEVISFDDAIDNLEHLSAICYFEFSDLYNAFYSSKPEIYIN